MFPPNIIANIGRFLDVGSKRQAHVASKVFSAIHEHETNHDIMMLNGDHPNKINETMQALKKLKPMTNSISITFKRSPFHIYDKNILLFFRNANINLIFKQCDFAFVAWTLQRIPFKISKCTISLKHDFSLLDKINQIVNDITSFQAQCQISLKLWDHPPHYIALLRHPVFSSMIHDLEMNVTHKNTLPIDIDLELLVNANRISLHVDKIARVRSLCGVEKITSLWLSCINHSFIIGERMRNHPCTLGLTELTVEHPELSIAYDQDSCIAQFLSKPKFDKEIMTLKFVNACDPDMPAFVHQVFEFYKFRHVCFCVYTDMDMICSRILQLLYPTCDIRIEIRSENVNRELGRLDNVRELYEHMDIECKWSWHMIKNLI